MTTLTATVRESGEGEQRWFCGGGLITLKATEQETGGSFLLFEDQLDGGKVTPLHLHADADETFCMLEGEIALVIDGERRVLGAGGIAFVPRVSRTPSWSPRHWRGCGACRRPARAKASTGWQASPSSTVNLPPPSTSDGFRTPRPPPTRSRSSARRRSRCPAAEGSGAATWSTQRQWSTEPATTSTRSRT